MCGIIGYVGPSEAVPILLGALARLEYRGYDSAGVATINGAGMEIRRAVGKLENLRRALDGAPLRGIDRNRPYAMGDARPPFGRERPSAQGRSGRGNP